MEKETPTEEEWEKEVRDMVMTKYAIFQAFKHPKIDGEVEMESLIDLISNRFTSLLSSHDAELRRKIEGMKVVMVKKCGVCNNCEGYVSECEYVIEGRAVNEALNAVLALLDEK